ncbi:MAG: ribosome recycling factor [Candidatus Babeliaceae bacterium]|nr:ribosome recycling factor [Candidatus Babeliaceae bacterium]
MIKLQFSADDSPSKFEQAVRTAMVQHEDFFAKEIAKLRTGRSHPSLVEDISVQCYGTAMRVKDLATITTPEANLIVIQPWDQGNLAAIEKGIALSNLQVAPTNDGALIRVVLPPMSAGRREELVKTLGSKLEECRVAIRNERKEFNNFIRDLEKNKSVSEDLAKRLQTILQKVTDELIGKAEKFAEKKELEIKAI